MENEQEKADSTVEESSSEIEKPKNVKRTKKDRSPAQVQSFIKAREKRNENVKKRELEKLEKYAKLKKEVRKDAGEEDVHRSEPQKKPVSKRKKKVVVVQEDSSSESDSSESSIEVVVKRKPKPKTKPKKEEEDRDYDTPPDTRKFRDVSQIISWI